MQRVCNGCPMGVQQTNSQNQPQMGVGLTSLSPFKLILIDLNTCVVIRGLHHPREKLLMGGICTWMLAQLSLSSGDREEEHFLLQGSRMSSNIDSHVKDWILFPFDSNLFSFTDCV